jgi:estrone sulfotransferase
MAETVPVRHRVKDVLRRSRALRGVAVAARHRGLRPDDIFVASYPRSGNTWIRFLLADLATGEPADFESVDRLIPGVGFHEGAPGLANAHRLIKTHEPYRSEYRRAVYFIRDPRDVLVSWYRVTRTDPDDLGEIDTFVHDFMTDRASPYGSWSEHIRGWRQAKQRGAQILFWRFEDMRSDPSGALREIARFVEIPADEGQIEAALARNSPQRMRELEREGAEYLRKAIGHRSRGVRQGATGSWRELLTAEHLAVLRPALELGAELGYG